MNAIDQDLPDSDGVKWFNRLYLRVTMGVASAVGSRSSMTRHSRLKLDVVFANLYFFSLHWPEGRPTSTGAVGMASALRGAEPFRDRAYPVCACRDERSHHAISRTASSSHFWHWEADPITDDLREKDFESVNEILERVEDEVKTEFTVGVAGAVDRLGGQVDDAVAMWKVRAARSAAWTNAQVLWGWRFPRLRDRFFDKLDGLVGMTGRGLLLPRGPFS